MSYLVKEGIMQALRANTALVALVSTNISSVYAPEEFPQAGAYIVFTQVSGNRETDHDGVDASALGRPRFQFTIGGTDPEMMDAVRDILVKQFDGLTFTDSTQAGGSKDLDFQYADDGELREPDSKVFKRHVDLYVWCNA